MNDHDAAQTEDSGMDWGDIPQEERQAGCEVFGHGPGEGLPEVCGDCGMRIPPPGELEVAAMRWLTSGGDGVGAWERTPVTRCTTAAGEYLVRLRIEGALPLMVKGGQQPYRPTDVLLAYSTGDGATWTFRHAVVTGPALDRMGRAGGHLCSMTFYLPDPYGAPSWLAEQVTIHHPGVKNLDGTPSVIVSHTRD